MFQCGTVCTLFRFRLLVLPAILVPYQYRCTGGGYNPTLSTCFNVYTTIDLFIEYTGPAY